MMMMMIQTQVGTPPDFAGLMGAVVGFERGLGTRAPVGDGAEGPSTRGIVATRFVGSAGGTGAATGTGGAGATGSRRAAAPEATLASAGSAFGMDAGVGVAEGCEPATAAGADRGALAIGTAVGSTAGSTFGAAGAGVCAPDLGGGCATSA